MKAVARVPPQVQIQFAIDLLDWMQQGITAWQALQLIQTSAAELGQRRLLEISQYVRTELSRGKSLGQSFSGWANSEIVVILDSGVAAEKMQQAMFALQRTTQQRQQWFKLIVQRMSYPFALFITSLIAMVFIGTQIIPRLLLERDDVTVPPATSLLMSASTLTVHVVLPVFMCLLLLGAGSLLLLSGRKWFLMPFLAHLNAFQIYRLLCSVRVLNQLSLMAQYARSLAASCVLLHHHASGLAKHHYQVMLDHYAVGLTDLAEIMDSGLLDSSALMRLRMSVGDQEQRSLQIAKLAMSLTERAEATILYRLRLMVWGLYAGAMIGVSWTAVGTGQAVFVMLENWNY